MKALVLGGSGFVGSYVVRALLRAGHEVAVLTRRPAEPGELRGVEVERIRGDLHAPESLAAAFHGRDLVVHAAGVLSLWPKHDGELYRTNVLGTRNVVEACLAAGVGRLVYTGSIGVYGGTPTPVPVDERGAPTPERFHSFHVTSMCLAEAEVWKGLARGLDAVLVHPSLCVGAGDRGFHSSWAMVGLSMIRVPVVPPGGLNVVDVEDVAHAHVLAAEKAPRGAAYLIGGENLTNRAYADLLGEVLGLSRLRLPLTRLGVRAAGTVAELVARARGVDRGTYITLNEAMSTAMSLYWFLDDTKARRELGYGSGPIRPAVERQVAWLRDEGFMPETGFGWRDFANRFLGGDLAD